VEFVDDIDWNLFEARVDLEGNLVSQQDQDGVFCAAAEVADFVDVSSGCAVTDDAEGRGTGLHGHL